VKNAPSEIGDEVPSQVKNASSEVEMMFLLK
jgi:hypothetical protein